MDTYTFTSSCGKFVFTIKKEFFHKFFSECTIEELPIYELMTKYKLSEFLHNPVGPAIINKISGNLEYWLNGKQVTEKESKVIAHTAKFNSEINDILKN